MDEPINQRKKQSSTDKGKMVERIVALMHKHPNAGVDVQQNVRLPPVHRKMGRKREIDVLLTGDVAGHTVRIAIECKNEQRPIDTPTIDAFTKKLERVGIPYGIFVSTSGYTSDAIETAAQDGIIKTFVLKDLTEEALYSPFMEAFYSVTYLFCQIVVIYVETATQTYTLLQAPFYDNDGRQCGSLGDLVWQRWVNEDLLPLIGPHEILLQIPSGWNFVADGKVLPVLSATAWVDISGLFGSKIGQAQGRVHSLVQALDNSVDRSIFEIMLDVSQDEYDKTWIHSESGLQKLLERTEIVRIYHRIKLPRIITTGIYWPPSKRVQSRVNELMEIFERGESPDPRPFSFDEMEGHSIRTAFEPIWEGYHFPPDLQ